MKAGSMTFFKTNKNATALPTSPIVIFAELQNRYIRSLQHITPSQLHLRKKNVAGIALQSLP